MQKQKYKKDTFMLLSLAHSINALCWMVPLLLPLIREELYLTYTQSGLLLTSYSIVLSIFTIVSGHLADVYEGRKVLAFGFLSTAAIYPLLLFVSSYVQIVAVLALVAVGISAFYPVGMASVSQSWQKGIYFGLFEAAGCMGVLIMTLLFTPLVSSFGWRTVPLILALPSLPMGLVFLTSRINLKYTRSTTHPEKTPAGSESLVLFYLARGVQIFGGVAVFSFMPLFAVDIAGLPAERASLFPTFIWTGAVPAVLIFGLLSDRFSPLKIILVLVFLTIFIVVAVTLVIPLPAIFILLIVLGFCSMGAWVPQNMWLSQVTLEEIRGKAFGGALSLVGLARIFSPLLFGFLADKWGLVASFRLATLPMIIAALCLGKLARENY